MKPHIKARINALAFWCDNRHVVDYESAFNIERELLAQLSAVQKELQEAREVEKSLCETIERNTASTTDALQDLRSQLKAATKRAEEAEDQLSTLYATGLDQQKELLALQAHVGELRAVLSQVALASGHSWPWMEAVTKVLASQPDTKLCDDVRELVEMMDSEAEFTIKKLGATVSTGGLLQLRDRAAQLLTRLGSSK